MLEISPSHIGRLIGIITEQIAYKNQHFALLRRECDVPNEHGVTSGSYVVVGAYPSRTFFFMRRRQECVHIT